MRYPESLKPGGRIGIIAPSFGCPDEIHRAMVESAAERFKTDGYKVVMGPNCYETKGIGKSNTPEACAAEINDFLINDRADAVLACRGGETMCEDLPFVDFDAIAKARPKWYMGFSDNTNLTFTLPTICDTAAIYGPNASNFGMRPWHRCISDSFDLMRGKLKEVGNYDGWEGTRQDMEPDPLAPFKITEPFRMLLAGTAKDGTAFSGRLIGGCLDCLSNMCGTRFDHAEEFADKNRNNGLIWFLEACDLTPLGVRVALWKLENAGWFKNVRGFLIGRPLHYTDEIMGLDRITAVTSILEKHGVPILMDLDIGHLPPMMPLVSGAMADVAVCAGDLSVKMRFE